MKANTISEALKSNASGDLEQQCIEMGSLLGLNQPVSPAVLKAALVDPTYAHHLLVSRGAPHFMEHLLNNPPTPVPDNEDEGFSMPTLLFKAGASLSRWGMTGFSTVSDDTYHDRLQICGSCPHLKAPPDRQQTIYAIAGAATTEKSVCGKCGCVVATKARRASETCPDAHPDQLGVNRWNDPMSC
jgi:hypothetical protein